MPSTFRASLLEIYGSGEGFLARLNPSKQIAYTSDECNAVMTKMAPNLHQVSELFGRKVAKAWLQCQIKDLSEYCGSKDKMDIPVIDNLSEILLAEFQFVKVSEYMLFFRWFKSGRYGQFYGAVDPIKIASSLRKFISEDKPVLIDRWQRKQQENRQDPDGISYEEYLKRTGNKPNPMIKMAYDALNG